MPIGRGCDASLRHADEACQSALHGGDVGTRLVLMLVGRGAVLRKSSKGGLLRPSNGVASCIGYHADHLELQFPCDMPDSLMCSANQPAHN